MTQRLHRLVYYSRNRMPEGADHSDQIAAILAASRRNNDAAQVSGALLFNAGCFGQVLEGPREAVEITFERIQRDPRHSEVSLLAFEAVEERAFPSWSMAFVGASLPDAERFAQIAPTTGYDPSRMTANRLFEALRQLALDEEQAA